MSHPVPDHGIAPLPRVSIQAFCETSDIAALVNAAAGDRRLDKVHVKVQMGGVAAAAEAYRNAPTPNVVLIETTHGRAELVAGLERLSEFCDAGTKVVVVGHLNDVLLYRDLMRRGVSEYLVAPIEVLDLVRALSELFRAPGAAPVGRAVSFIGARGGVGASTVAHNVAWAVARQLELATVVADLDLAFGTAGLDFNQDPPQGIGDIVAAPDRIDAGLVDRLLSKCAERLSLLAAPSTLERPYDLSETAFDAVLDILRSNVPLIVLDLPHLWSAWTRRLLLASDEVVIVATPDLASLRNTKNLVDLLKQHRTQDAAPRLVLNMAGVPKRPEIKTADFAKAIEIEPMAVVSFDPAMFGTAANNGQMIAEANPSSRQAELFLAVAQAVAGRAETRRGRRSLLEPLMTRLQRKKA